MEKIIGIDLGTTNSLVAVVENGQCNIISDMHGNKMMPSIVGITNDNNIIVGEEAKRQYLAAPENTIKSIKRKMGTDQQFQLGNDSYTPTAISAIILKSLKQRAEKHLNTAITKAVITVPAYFSDAQRQATKEAGEIAGLEVLRILNEPTAAAIAYQIGSKQSETALIYDLGGGTFDVSIVEMNYEITEVLASHGNNMLGGDDFDNKLAHWLDEKFYAKNKIHLFDDPVSKVRLLSAAENAKIKLTEHVFLDVVEEFIAKKDKTALHLQEHINRDDFDKLIQPLLMKTTDAIDIALKDAELTANEIDKVILVGGSTKIPLVRKLIEDHLNQQVYDVIEPDLCVAAGVGYHAGVQAGEEIESILVDVTPYSLGVQAGRHTFYGIEEDYFSVIIPRNSVVPCSKSEIYTNPMLNMPYVNVSVYQGEHEYVDGNIHLASFKIKDLPPAPPFSLKIEVHFDFDINGILHVTAKEEKSDENFSIQISQSTQRMSPKDISKAQQQINDLFVGEIIEPENNDDIPLPESIQDLCRKAKNATSTLEDDDEINDILSLINDIKKANHEKRQNDLDDLVNELQDILFYIENQE